ncbi:MAG: hypothetical protein IPH20_24390 [Bacteroidales bacterium]|nr:hypothetical protein [Bacteroidales bacterium]
MKTLITIIIAALLAFFSSNSSQAGNENSFASNYPVSSVVVDTLGTKTWPIGQIYNRDEAYIDDIPFDTKEIASGYLVSGTPAIEPEPYINDIPFRTDYIANKFLPSRMVILYPESENYINDIPFNTESIAAKYLCRDTGKFCCRVVQF